MNVRMQGKGKKSVSLSDQTGDLADKDDRERRAGYYAKMEGDAAADAVAACALATAGRIHVDA
jgi:hypothetical protein